MDKTKYHSDLVNDIVQLYITRILRGKEDLEEFLKSMLIYGWKGLGTWEIESLERFKKQLESTFDD